MAESYKTVSSSLTPFATAYDLTTYRDWRHVADLLEDEDQRVVSKEAVDGAGVEASQHPTVTVALRTASGMIEQACYRGGRYARADLNRMLVVQPDPDGGADAYTVCRDMLKQMTCDLAFWVLVKRRKPDVQMRGVAGVGEAMMALEALRVGEAIFPFTEAAAAGVMDYTMLDPNASKTTYNAVPIDQLASRMFGTRGRDIRSGY